VREAVRAGSLSSAHDIAEGGLAIALAECCLAGSIGAEIELRLEEPAAGSPDAALFGEGPGGFVVSGTSEALSALGERIAVTHLGTVGGDALTLGFDGHDRDDGPIVLSLQQLAQAHASMAELFA
jgi:phosphoribosylformylglycinamidine synthase